MVWPMGHHGVIVRLEAKCDPPLQPGDSLHLWSPATRAHPLAGVVESIEGGVATVRVLTGPDASFVTGTTVEVQRSSVAVGTGKVM